MAMAHVEKSVLTAMFRWRRPRSRPTTGDQDRDGPAAFGKAAMAWIALVFAGVFEIVWASAMKQSHGFTKLWPSVVTGVGMLISFGLLAWAMRSLPLGTAYTIWTGIGAVGAFIVGIVIFGEAATALRLIAAALIVSGLVLMKVSSTA
ncbi:multidrug efflux SMR transporter [Sphingomonas sp. OV641]|uniref:DMT family transporter n=1 Tax=Sphingomonas sp. OV641 TaxID=1881068 RepID=UPI00352782AA